MPDDAHPDGGNRIDERRDESHADESRSDEETRLAVETIEAYETDDGIVLYDSQNPLAWVKASSSIALADHL